ncbi:AMP-binding protein, partial [Actinosynnema sp. NPDC023658]|uniref:AMP-binding protein n=1 Tax=Actinosynnema sp. NPDC023658 TaxID=3155465 RepID=UPI0034080B65
LEVGLPVAARAPRAAAIPGMVSNIVPLRLRPRSEQSIGEYLRETARALRGAVRHQRYRYEDLRRDQGLLAGGARLVGPHVNIVVLDQVLDFAGAVGHVANLAGGPVDDVSLVVDGRAGGLDLCFDLNPDLYTAEAAADVVSRFGTLLGQVLAAGADAPLGHLELVTDDERALVASWNDNTVEVVGTTVPALFEAQVERTPDAVAVVFGDEVLTYRELNSRANRLARLLVAHGVGPERFTALAVPRSATMITALLAVLKAGGAYLPVDPAHPADRIAQILGDAAPALILTTSDAGVALPAGLPVLVLDELPAAVRTGQAVAELDDADLDDADRLSPLLSDHAAYVIHTSGSTGRPKGVMIGHGALGNFLLSMRDRPGLAPGAAVLALTTV